MLKVFGGLIKGDKELEEIREWYDGYWWLGSKIYNPFDVLLYLQNRESESYWFETGNPGEGGPYPRVFSKANKGK